MRSMNSRDMDHRVSALKRAAEQAFVDKITDDMGRRKRRAVYSNNVVNTRKSVEDSAADPP